MHVLGLPEFEMPRTIEDDSALIIEIVRYVCQSDRPIGDECGPQFQAIACSNDRFEPGSPMFNPWGRLKLVSIKNIAENN